MKTKRIKLRDWNAVDAHFRNSAGAMKDRRTGRGGTTNTTRDFVDEYYDEILDCDRVCFYCNNINCVCDFNGIYDI